MDYGSVSGFEPGLLEPTSHETDFWSDVTSSKITVRLDFQCALVFRCHVWLFSFCRPPVAAGCFWLWLFSTGSADGTSARGGSDRSFEKRTISNRGLYQTGAWKQKPPPEQSGGGCDSQRQFLLSKRNFDPLDFGGLGRLALFRRLGCLRS